jgi:hypothetical protein
MRAGSGEDELMNLRLALLITACLLAVAAGPAAAQQQPQQAAPAQWGAPMQQPPQAGPSPWSAPPQQQEEPACAKGFGVLRDDAAKKAAAIRAASERKAPATEACKLFNVFTAAEAKMLKYAVDNATSCGIPPQIITSIKQQHAKTTEYRTRLCQAAAAPQRPAAPTLSDALTAPITDSNNIKTGGGTFDTLTGTPLGSK